LLDDRVATLLEHLVESAHHHQRQDHLAIVGLLVVAAQQLGDAPDQVRVVADPGAVCLQVIAPHGQGEGRL